MKEEIKDTIIVILSGDIVLGSPAAAIKEQKSEGLIWLDFIGDIKFIKN